MIQMLRTTGLTLFAALVTGCGCAGVGLNQVTPAEKTLRVGESVTLVYETGGGCRSGNRTTDIDLNPVATIWHSPDTLIVTLDTLTGRVTGRAPGDAYVISGGGSGSRIHVQ